MIINLTTPMSDDKERQRRNKAVLDAIEQYTEERMADEYGRIHTDGNRSGGQPTQADIDAAESIFWVETTIDDHEAVAKAFARHRQYGYDQGYYDGQRDRPPTQSDALRDQLLQECLVKLRDVQGTEAPKQYACNLIKRIERVLQVQSK